MLNLVGRSTSERAKSITIGLLIGLLMLSLWQMSTGNAQANREDQNRQDATDVARRFAIALTTYDYAHPEVQRLNVAAVSSQTVQEEVSSALQDVLALEASSLGDIRDSIVSSLTNTGARVIVSTSQVISSRDVVTATQLQGLLEVSLSRSPQSWIVTNYRWLAVPVNAP
jgi:hypothetical protein